MANPHPGGVMNGIDDRHMRRGQGQFPYAGSAKRTIFPWRFEIMNVEPVRDVLWIRDTARHERRVLVELFKILGQGQADALSNASVNLAVHNQFVVDLPDVCDHRVPFHRGLPGLGVYSHFGHEKAVHVYGKGRSLRRLEIAVGIHGGGPLSRIPQRDFFGHHLVISSVGPVRLSHGCDQKFTAVLDGVAGDDLLPAATRRTAVRSQGHVVHHLLDLVRRDSQGAQCFMRGTQSAHVRALAVVFPGGGQSHAILCQFHRDLGGVGAVDSAAVDAEADAHSLFDLRGGFLVGLFLCRLVQRSQLVDHLREAVNLRRLSGRRRVAFAVDVLGAEFQRIHFHFRRKLVHQAFGSEEALGRTIGAKGGTPSVVGADRAALAPDVGNTVAGAHELSAAQSEQVPEFRVRPVVHAPVCFHGHDLSILVRAILDFHPEGRALPGVRNVLEVVISEEHWSSRGHTRDT